MGHGSQPQITALGRLPAGATVAPYAPDGGPLPPGIALFDVRWPPPGPGRARFCGRAVIEDDVGVSVLDLRQASDLGRLLALVWDCGSDCVAELVARYARSGPFDILVRVESDVGDALDRSVARELGLGPPESHTAADGGRSVSFHTFHLRPEPPDQVIRAGVDAWIVTMSPEGDVEWAVRPVARRLESPRYAVRGGG